MTLDTSAKDGYNVGTVFEMVFKALTVPEQDECQKSTDSLGVRMMRRLSLVRKERRRSSDGDGEKVSDQEVQSIKHLRPRISSCGNILYKRNEKNEEEEDDDVWTDHIQIEHLRRTKSLGARMRRRLSLALKEKRRSSEGETEVEDTNPNLGNHKSSRLPIKSRGGVNMQNKDDDEEEEYHDVWQSSVPKQEHCFQFQCTKSLEVRVRRRLSFVQKEKRPFNEGESLHGVNTESSYSKIIRPRANSCWSSLAKKKDNVDGDYGNIKILAEPNTPKSQSSCINHIACKELWKTSSDMITKSQAVPATSKSVNEKEKCDIMSLDDMYIQKWRATGRQSRRSSSFI